MPQPEEPEAGVEKEICYRSFFDRGCGLICPVY